MNYKTDTGEQENVTSITLIELAQHIGFKKSSKGALMNCPFCGKDAWYVQSNLTDPNKPVIIMMPLLDNAAASMWFFPLSCSNCGYTINFNAKTVADEITARKTKP